jgi:hypothetical protein
MSEAWKPRKATKAATRSLRTASVTVRFFNPAPAVVEVEDVDATVLELELDWAAMLEAVLD